MRTVLAATMMSLLLAGSVFLVVAMDNPPMSETSPETSADAADGDPAAPAVTDPGADEAGAPPSEDQAGTKDGIMQNFTRHRPGACPEGPPCHVEDGD